MRSIDQLRRCLLLLLASVVSCHAISTERKIIIMNESKKRVEIKWMNPSTGELVPATTSPDVLNGASANINSYVGHQFMVRELPGKKTAVCAGDDNICRVDYFTVNENSDQIVFVREGIEVEHTDSKSVANKSALTILSQCKSAEVNRISDPSSDYGNNPDAILDSLEECIKGGIFREMQHVKEEISFQSGIRTQMAELLENYTCADEKLNTTEAKSTTSWRNRYRVSVMIDRPAAKLHIIENFTSEDECKALEMEAAPNLAPATNSDGNGGYVVSDRRRAMQAKIEVDWENEAEGDLIAGVSRRILDYTNDILPLDLKDNGQQDLMFIQYTGRGPEYDKPDRYVPHCDGFCEGNDVKPGHRIATMLMYCQIPTLGGATNFRNAGIHIKPKQYSAAFFSYMNPESMKNDDGLTQHSGCPVIEGEKKIVTKWLRFGVDDENPWHSFNSLGIKHSDIEEQ